jgi:hypothetical protein
VQQLLDNPACLVLSGTAGDPAAGLLARAELRQLAAPIAHVAPWLQNSSVEVDERTFPIFAARQEQIGHALRSLTVMGVSEVGAVYASQQEYQLYQQDLERIASGMKLKLQRTAPTATWTAWASASRPAPRPSCCLWAAHPSWCSSPRGWKSSSASATSWRWPT